MYYAASEYICNYNRHDTRCLLVEQMLKIIKFVRLNDSIPIEVKTTVEMITEAITSNLISNGLILMSAEVNCVTLKE